MSKHPTQPLEMDEHGVVRFKRNHVVRYLLDATSAGRQCDLNEVFIEVATGRMPVEDYMQLMQLIGYSISGYGDLAYSQEDKRWRKHADKMDAKAAEVYADWQKENSKPA